MQSDVWQQLLALESVDLVSSWHSRIHSRTLNLKRATEITASARQAREFFRNASNSDDTVRPLLTFYGVASLARSTVLLLKRDNGEESLAPGHGLEACGWKNTISGEHSEALRNLGELRVETRAGLYTDFLSETSNRICLHVNSSAVDGRYQYPDPPFGAGFTLQDLLIRLPDISREMSQAGIQSQVANVQTVNSSGESIVIDVSRSSFEQFANEYADHECDVVWHSPVTASIKFPNSGNDSFQPQFAHSYLSKSFGSIPNLHIVKPFDAETRLSQLAMTYLLGYYLGMLTRYFPTHWIALQQGTRGDALWPAIHAAQKYVELVFPELVIELVLDIVDGNWQRLE